jgi:hypothetical protein
MSVRIRVAESRENGYLPDREFQGNRGIYKDGLYATVMGYSVFVPSLS